MGGGFRQEPPPSSVQDIFLKTCHKEYRRMGRACMRPFSWRLSEGLFLSALFPVEKQYI
jgi:hypothetical protein